MAQNYPKWPKNYAGIYAFFRNFLLTEKAVPQTFLLLECMLHLQHHLCQKGGSCKLLIARSHFLGERRLSLVACAALLPFDHDHHERHEEHEHLVMVSLQ